MSKVRSSAVVVEPVGRSHVQVTIVEACTQTARFALALPEARILVNRLQFALARATAAKFADREPLERSALPK